MPELPDITLYVEALNQRVSGQVLRNLRIRSPFLVRTYDPPIREAKDCTITSVERLGKRIVLHLDSGQHLVIHLMIAGRLRWKKPGASANGRDTVAVFDFDDGALLYTEASKKKRASLHLVRDAGLAALDRGGLNALTCDLAAFTERLRLERHTLKRTLTDPRLFDGIGNAYSDEILHRAQLSPTQLSTNLKPPQIEVLHQAILHTLTEWTERLRVELKGKFPDKVTAFHPKMAVHGRHKQPCPVCTSPIQRIVHGDHETNYCATCQTRGKLLKDRALSQLLKDWPKTLAELEERKKQ